MSPILALVIQPLIEHFHDLNKVSSECQKADQRGEVIDKSGHSTGCTSAGRFRSSEFPMGPMGH